jgi:hypothetical protein
MSDATPENTPNPPQAEQGNPVPPVTPPPAAQQPYGQSQQGYAPQQPVIVQNYASAYAPAPPRGLSITSLVLGIVGLCVGWAMLGLPSLAAVIFGHIGMKREPAGRGLAIGGLITGYVGIVIGVIAIIVTIVSILLPLLVVWGVIASTPGSYY